VDEDKGGDKGEVSKLNPVTTQPGMWTEFEVTK
jgi:hypothetical protein